MCRRLLEAPPTSKRTSRSRRVLVPRPSAAHSPSPPDLPVASAPRMFYVTSKWLKFTFCLPRTNCFLMSPRENYGPNLREFAVLPCRASPDIPQTLRRCGRRRICIRTRLWRGGGDGCVSALCIIVSLNNFNWLSYFSNHVFTKLLSNVNRSSILFILPIRINLD